jgi:teichuronic acid biosynthesis glycosyltransferase TuaC
MKLLVLPSGYPYPGHPYSGVFNEKCVNVLKDLCQKVEVMVPHPYIPDLISSLSPRWKTYATAASFEIRNGVPIHRPPYLRIPRLAAAFWGDTGAFLCCRSKAREMHRRVQYDAILSFDLYATGGVAWRLARDLGVPASGWAFGDDVRSSPSSPIGRVVRRALARLDLVFYQSHELLQAAARLLGTSPSLMSERHMVLPHGIPEPPVLARDLIRKSLRKEWGITEHHSVILSIGRIVREKGVFELLEAISLASAQNPRIFCVLIGSIPAFDETPAFKNALAEMPHLKQKVIIVPACNPSQVWEYLCAADIFAFTSHKEGMPNSLLEAMVTGLPSISFAIPPALEIDAGKGALVLVPAFDTKKFSDALLRLSASPKDRHQFGRKGRTQVLDRFMVRNNMAVAVKRFSHEIKNHSGSTARGIDPQHKYA